MKRLLLSCLLLGMLLRNALAAEIELPTIVKEGSASDVLMEDPIVPEYRGKSRTLSPSGGLEQGISQDLPIPVLDTGQPGNLSQVRGLGQSAEEVNVQSLGIPLNSPQGGRGFDFSTFPEFFWDDYQFRLGPSLGVFDPAGISGSLTLHPWTETMLGKSSGGRVTGFVSDVDLRQYSAGASAQDRVAALIGYSSGRVKGPTGSLSAQQRFGNHRARFHFLGTDVDALSRQSLGAPFDQKNTTRWIPVAQTDFDLGGETLLKNTFFYDTTFIHAISGGGPGGRTSSTRTSNLGTQNAIVVGNWKFGLSAEHIDYQSMGVGHFQQNAFNLQGARSFSLNDAGSTFIEPTVRGTLVSGYSLLPEASLGLSHLYTSQTSGFARVTYSRKFPTLADRYYSFPRRFEGNPGLKPEHDWTAVIGGSFNDLERRWNLTTQLYSQYRVDGQVLTSLSSGSLTYVNADRATIHAAMITGGFHATPWLELKDGITAAVSHVSSTGETFPFVPALLNVFTARFHEATDDPLWDTSLIARTSTWSGTSTLRERTPGYALLDFRAGVRVWKVEAFRLDATGGIKNLMDRQIEIVKDNPIEGRAFSLNLVGTF